MHCQLDGSSGEGVVYSIPGGTSLPGGGLNPQNPMAVALWRSRDKQSSMIVEWRGSRERERERERERDCLGVNSIVCCHSVLHLFASWRMDQMVAG